MFFDSVQSSRVLGLVRQFNCSGVSIQAETCSEKMFRLEKRDNIMCSRVLRDNIKQARDMKCCARCK